VDPKDYYCAGKLASSTLQHFRDSSPFGSTTRSGNFTVTRSGYRRKRERLAATACLRICYTAKRPLLRMNVNLRLVSGTLLAAGVLSCCTKLDSGSDTFGAGGVLLGTGGSVSQGSSGSDSIPTGGLPGQAGTATGGISGDFAGISGGGGRTAGRGGATHGSGGSHSATGPSGESGAAGEAGAAGSDGECIDATGFHGVGCNRCTPTDIVSLEQACTTATCTGFDNFARLTGLPSSGKLPPLPAPSPGQGGMAGTGGTGSGATAGTGTAGSGTAGGGSGGAGFDCASLAQSGTIVYVTGSSASKPFLQQIAQQIASDGVYIVYTSTGSCVGVDAIVNGTPMTTGPAPAPATTATYWADSASNGSACDLPAGGVPADLGVSDVFAETCPGFELTDLDAQDIRDAHGPIQTMTFAVPTNSPYSEISAQAAYFVAGFGANGGVLDPTHSKLIWDDENYIFQRSASSGTQAMISSAIGVPPGSWKGKPHKTSDDVAADLEAAAADDTKAAAAIGIIAADYIDTKNLRAQIRVLAYQDTRGPCAVYPDSTASAHDKENVRDGHYPIWGPLHLLYKVDQSGNPVNDTNRQAVSDIVGYLSGTKPLPNGVKLLDVYAQSGLVPECAMHVTRTSDGGDITPRAPANPCSCSFDVKATGATSCTPCTVQGDCASGETCSQGYCEK
jgi:hypothetical protein